MKNLLSDEKYDFINETDKKFVIEFNDEMLKAGYANNGIQPYACFGKYKIEYYKAGLKSKKYIARIYFRDYKAAERFSCDIGIALRMYFDNIDKRKNYIENAPNFIKLPFVDNHSVCKGCKKDDDKMVVNGKCRYKKTYIIDGKSYIKCAEQAFMFEKPLACNASEYVGLLSAFHSISPSTARKLG